MQYYKTILLKNGKECCLRNGTERDGQAVLENFNLVHAQTDFLLSYPDENSFDAEMESRFLKEKSESENEIEIIAVVDGAVVGTAGIEAVGAKYKVRHRAELGISIAEEFWGLGIGRELTDACIECAREAEYTQLELSVVAENTRAVTLYKKAGFIEYGRNPKGFNSRTSGFQEIIHMRLELQ
ncbi:MAG: GNAT family N-acetyltransferase [Acutalibacteraceae bacterium]